MDTQLSIKHFSKLPTESKISLLSMAEGAYISRFNSGGALKSNTMTAYRMNMSDLQDAYGLYVGDELVGYFSFYAIKDDRVLSAFYMISKWHAGQGHGKRLMSVLLREAAKRMKDGNLNILRLPKGHKFQSFELLIDDANISSIKMVKPYSTPVYSGFMRGMRATAYAVDMNAVESMIQIGENGMNTPYEIDNLSQFEMNDSTMKELNDLIAGIEENKMEDVSSTSSVQSVLSEMEDLRRKDSSED